MPGVFKAELSVNFILIFAFSLPITLSGFLAAEQNSFFLSAQQRPHLSITTSVGS